MSTAPCIVTIASFLEPEQIARIRAVDARIVLRHDPALIAAPRYVADHGRADFVRTPAQEQQWLAMLADTEVLFDFDRPHMHDLHTVAPKLKWLQATSAGIGQTVVRHGLHKSGIQFCTASGVHVRPLADFCSMAMLMFVKGYFLMAQDKAAKHWARTCADELTGKTLAIIGLGKIGREIARQGRFFEMNVIGTSRSAVAVPNVDQVFAPNQLDGVLAQADFLVLIAPHTAETDALIGARELALIKPGAVLINIARGALIDEAALIAVLRSGHLAGAALDVFHTEPLPVNSPLWEMPNVIISPHSASTVLRENERIVDVFCDNLRRWLDGRPLRNVLDADRLY